MTDSGTQPQTSVSIARDEAQAIINLMAERWEEVHTKYEICSEFGWPQNGWRFGFRMARARRPADDQGFHLSFCVIDDGCRGYILTKKNVEIAIRGVTPRVRQWVSAGENIGRTGRFISRHAHDPIRRRLGALLDKTTTQARDNATEIAGVLDMYEQQEQKREAAKARQTAKLKRVK